METELPIFNEKIKTERAESLLKLLNNNPIVEDR